MAVTEAPAPRAKPRRRPLPRWIVAAAAVCLVATTVAILVPDQPPVRPAAVAPPGDTARTVVAHGPPGEWLTIFADEFEGAELDTTKWLPCVSHGQLGHRAECTGWNEELQTYRPENVVVRNGALHLVAQRTPEGAYTSGAVTTAVDVFGYDQPGYSDFTYRYGYTEVRFRAPAGAGMWPAVWGLPYNSDGDEIDIIEVVKGSAFFTLHTGSWLGGGQHELAGIDFSQDWHTVGTLWEPGEITWYLDGAEVYSVTADVPDQPFFVQANLAVGGEWPGPPDASTPFPGSFDIDYVRVFQHADASTATF